MLAGREKEGEMYKFTGARKEAQMRPKKEYYAYQDGNCVGIFKCGDRLPEDAVYYEVIKSWDGPKQHIGVKSRKYILHEDDVVHVKYKVEEGKWQEEVGTVRLLTKLGLDLNSADVKVSEVEWNKEDQWRVPKTAEPQFGEPAEETKRERIKRRREERKGLILELDDEPMLRPNSGDPFRF